MKTLSLLLTIQSNIEELLQRIRRLEEGIAKTQVMSPNADAGHQGVFTSSAFTSEVVSMSFERHLMNLIVDRSIGFQLSLCHAI